MTRSSSGTLPAQSEAPETSTALAAVRLSALTIQRNGQENDHGDDQAKPNGTSTRDGLRILATLSRNQLHARIDNAQHNTSAFGLGSAKPMDAYRGCADHECREDSNDRDRKQHKVSRAVAKLAGVSVHSRRHDNAIRLAEREARTRTQVRWRT